jgi:hypothetical protein
VTGPLVFLTDTEPQKHRVDKLCVPAREVIARQPTAPAPRAWFTAANNLALALVLTGAPGQAAHLMELSVELAGRLSTVNADDIEYGVESCMNRIDLVRQEDGDAAEHAYRSCYGLVTGRPVSKRHLFGLNVGALNSASRDVVQWTLAILRYRSQLGLLKLYLRAGGLAEAAEFAREVVSDFPGPVRAGMLHPAEVLAVTDHDDPFLRQFDIEEPATEGDFVVLLRTMGKRAAPPGPNVATDTGHFASAVARFQAGHALRNPRTPLLWTVHHGLALSQDWETMRPRAVAALEECRREDDRSLYRSIATLVRDHTAVPPFPAADTTSMVDPQRLVAALVRAGPALPWIRGAGRTREASHP